MNVRTYRSRNRWHRLGNRLAHPWPIYKRVGGINAVVNRADGTTEDLGRISETYMRRGMFSVQTGDKPK